MIENKEKRMRKNGDNIADNKEVGSKILLRMIENKEKRMRKNGDNKADNKDNGSETLLKRIKNAEKKIKIRLTIYCKEY